MLLYHRTKRGYWNTHSEAYLANMIYHVANRVRLDHLFSHFSHLIVIGRYQGYHLMSCKQYEVRYAHKIVSEPVSVIILSHLYSQSSPILVIMHEFLQSFMLLCIMQRCKWLPKSHESQYVLNTCMFLSTSYRNAVDCYCFREPSNTALMSERRYCRKGPVY